MALTKTKRVVLSRSPETIFSLSQIKFIHSQISILRIISDISLPGDTRSWILSCVWFATQEFIFSAAAGASPNCTFWTAARNSSVTTSRNAGFIWNPSPRNAPLANSRVAFPEDSCWIVNLILHVQAHFRIAYCTSHSSRLLTLPRALLEPVTLMLWGVGAQQIQNKAGSEMTAKYNFGGLCSVILSRI